MIVAGAVKDLSAGVHLAADGSQVATGTVYCVVRLESGDADDGKYWDSNDDTWQASPVAWPTATHTQAGIWVFALPAAASTGKAGSSIAYTFTDNLTEASATTVSGGGEHHIWAEDPLGTADIPSSDITTIKNKTDNLPSDPADQSLLMAEHATTLAAIPTVGEIDTELTSTHGSGVWTSDISSGARAIVLHTQEADTTTIQEATVSIYSDAGRTNLVTRVTTDTNGDFDSIGLDDGTYYWTARKSLYSFTSGSFVVSANGTKNITGVSVGATPAGPSLCACYCTIEVGGVAVAGSPISATITSPSFGGGVVYGEEPIRDVTDSNGLASIDLPQGATVELRVIARPDLSGTYTVPASSSQDITTWTKD